MDDDMWKTLWQKEIQEVPAERKMQENKNGKDRSKRKLIDEVNYKNEDILCNIGHIEQLEQYLLIRKRWCILALAENFEELHDLGEYKEPLYTMDRSIYKLAQEYGLSVAQNWIHEILPAKYKQPMLYLSLYNADELGELLASTLLSRFPPSISSPLVTTTIEEKGDKRAGVKRGDPYEALKTNYEG